MLTKLLDQYNKIANTTIPGNVLDSDIPLDDILKEDWEEWEKAPLIGRFSGELLYRLKQHRNGTDIVYGITSSWFRKQDIVVRTLCDTFPKIDIEIMNNIIKCFNESNDYDIPLPDDFICSLTVILYERGCNRTLAGNVASMLRTYLTDEETTSNNAGTIIGLTQCYAGLLSVLPNWWIPDVDIEKLQVVLEGMQNNDLYDVLQQLAKYGTCNPFPLWFFESPEDTVLWFKDAEQLAEKDACEYAVRYADLGYQPNSDFLMNFTASGLTIRDVLKYPLLFHVVGCAPSLAGKALAKIGRLDCMTPFLVMLLEQNAVKAVDTILAMDDEKLIMQSRHFLLDTKITAGLFDYDRLTGEDYSFLFGCPDWHGYKYLEDKITAEEFRHLSRASNSYMKLFNRIRCSMKNASEYVMRLSSMAALQGIKEEEDIGRVAVYLEGEDILQLYEDLHLRDKAIPMRLLIRAVLNGNAGIIPRIENKKDAIFLSEHGDIALADGQTITDIRRDYVKFDFDSNRMCRMLKIDTIRDSATAARLADLIVVGTVAQLRWFFETSRYKTPYNVMKKAVIEYLAGNYHGFKYKDGELSRELAMPVPKGIQEGWEENICYHYGDLRVTEYDGLEHIMDLGVTPSENALNPKTGKYRDVLASLLNANKKIVEVSKDGVSIQKYVMTMTKYISNSKVEVNANSSVEYSRLEPECNDDYKLCLLYVQVNRSSAVSAEQAKLCTEAFSRYKADREKSLGLAPINAKDKTLIFMVPYTRAGRQFLRYSLPVYADDEGSFRNILGYV